jgi:putative drug exporter of the RND superfamily
MTSLARIVLRHRRLVIAAWLVLLVAGAIGAGRLSDRLSLEFSLPGQPGYETAKRIEAVYGNGGAEPPSVVVVSGARAEAVHAAFAKLRRARPELRVVDDPRFVTRDGRTRYALVFAPRGRRVGGQAMTRTAGAMRAWLPIGASASATGLSELASGGSARGPGVFAETVIGALGALAVLAFVFASVLAILPIVIAAVAILTTLLVVLGLTYLTDVSFIVEFLAALVGLGVAIDYSLLLVTRWREERARGLANGDAVVAAMSTAGRSVAISGLTVAIGLVALVVLPEPALRSVGFGGMLIPLVSVAVTLSLLPALLGGIGPRVDWPRRRREAHASRPWTAWAGLVVRRRWLAAAVGVAALALLVAPARDLTTGETSASAYAKTGPARAAYDRLLAGGVPSGVLTPLEALTRGGAAPDARARLARVPGMAEALVTTRRAGTAIVLGIPREQTDNARTLAPVKVARTALDGRPGVVGIAGAGALALDYQHAIFGSFPVMFALIAAATLLLLMRAFRSVVLAVKALVLNLLSLGATFGVMTWFWQEGHGSQPVFGIPGTGAITFWLPLMVFAFLFGLSMDYEVFILSRIREEYERTGSTSAAVVAGLGRTGRLVTSAALVLFLAFASLASGPNTDIKVFATALGAGILLDATVVRALLLPALVAIFGRWNWWWPWAQPSTTSASRAPVSRALRRETPGS